MKTLLLSLLCFLVWNQHTEALTDQQVTLGETVTVACEFRLKAVVWFVIKPSARPMMIMRTFGTEDAEYYDEKLRSKYSEGSRSHLIINDVSADDLGEYYCVQPGWSLVVNDGIRLHTAGVPKDDNEPQDLSSNQIVLVILACLVAVMFVAIIGLLMKKHKFSRTSHMYENNHRRPYMVPEHLRRNLSIQINSNCDPPRNPMAERNYLQILPNNIYETPTCGQIA
ncbi:uncharacterized protein [Danio rerio]|uniref:Immunoglobulin domain-containing protein n=1 Tax=Danio rerio TaxID=7955 RepID=A0A8M2BLN9_DANRE|nr:uncharacterized protein LOC100148254 [Danio rerio]|eukprot:XP_005174066.1 uncharacterized protein LOC100148254 [Danio rerio]